MKFARQRWQTGERIEAMWVKSELCRAIFAGLGLILSGFLPCSVAKGKTADEEYVLFCVTGPALNSIKTARPDSFWDAVGRTPLHQELDENGEGILWMFAHWVEIKDAPKENDRVNIPGEFHFRAVSHAAVIRGFWVYAHDSNGTLRKKAWVWRTVAHVIAGNEESQLRFRAEGEAGSSKAKRVPVVTEAHSNQQGAKALQWKGKTIGWVSAAWMANGGKFDSQARWFEAGRDDELAKATGNPIGEKHGRQPWRVIERSLNWSFAIWPASTQKDSGTPFPELGPDFQVPPQETR